MSSTIMPRPPYDPALEAAINMMMVPKPPTQISQSYIDTQRAAVLCHTGPATKALLTNPAFHFEERGVPGRRGDISVVIWKSSGPAPASPRPGIIHLHGGGMWTGDVYLGMTNYIEWVTEMDAVVVMVDYRLAPEFQDLALVEDCYAALQWVGDNFVELGIDPVRILLEGASAGGGLAAGAALMARDKGGPKLCGLMLMCPMLDDRNNTLSCRQFADTYTGALNAFSWKCVLGDRMGAEDVSPYVSPARASDLSGLPEVFIDVGSSEPFRDESVEFASKLWAAGSQAELHIWPGGPHGFFMLSPTADVSKCCKSTQLAWMRRKLMG